MFAFDLENFSHIPFSDKKLFLFRLFLDKQIGLRVLFHLVCWKNVCCPFPESKTSKKCLTTRNVIKLVWKSVLKVFILAYYQDKVPDFNSCAALPPVVDFDQLLGASRTQKLVETFFSAIFQLDFSREITKKALKWTTKVEKRLKKMFRPAFGCAQHPKAGRNTQQPLHHVCIFYSVAYSIIIYTFRYYSIYEYLFWWMKLPDLLPPFWPFLLGAFPVRREPDSSQLFHPSCEICQSCTCKLWNKQWYHRREWYASAN